MLDPIKKLKISSVGPHIDIEQIENLTMCGCGGLKFRGIVEIRFSR